MNPDPPGPTLTLDPGKEQPENDNGLVSLLVLFGCFALFGIFIAICMFFSGFKHLPAWLFITGGIAVPLLLFVLCFREIRTDSLGTIWFFNKPWTWFILGRGWYFLPPYIFEVNETPFTEQTLVLGGTDRKMKLFARLGSIEGHGGGVTEIEASDVTILWRIKPQALAHYAAQTQIGLQPGEELKWSKEGVSLEHRQKLEKLFQPHAENAIRSAMQEFEAVEIITLTDKEGDKKDTGANRRRVADRAMELIRTRSDPPNKNDGSPGEITEEHWSIQEKMARFGIELRDVAFGDINIESAEARKLLAGVGTEALEKLQEDKDRETLTKHIAALIIFYKSPEGGEFPDDQARTMAVQHALMLQKKIDPSDAALANVMRNDLVLPAGGTRRGRPGRNRGT